MVCTEAVKPWLPARQPTINAGMTRAIENYLAVFVEQAFNLRHGGFNVERRLLRRRNRLDG
jgi:hypothetical protein